ncbi:amidase family protein [Polaribacter pacificus]|nr:amidase family protein [Polaribacter pacificus]
MKFKLLQSKYLDMNAVFKPFERELATFTEEDYSSLKPLVLEQNIPSLQQKIKEGSLSYEKLTLFYLYRIRKFESDTTLYLNSIIALNPDVLKEARKKDKAPKAGIDDYSLFGMPILLKDNINTKGMPTTAGAIALANNNNTEDAFIVQKLKANGALILGKVNLSEWAYFFCSGCPVGYSAVGGQTLNPYGRKIFETGGSSSGSGVSVAANFAVAAVGTETSGSITSPSSQNSVVGLKPTVGVLSRTGIVPISSTLDTPGPMTKNVLDNAIFLKAMLGYDANDAASKQKKIQPLQKRFDLSIKGKRLGVLKSLLSNSMYKATVDQLKNAGAEIIEIAPPNLRLTGFISILNIDMKYDLPNYLKNNADTTVTLGDIDEIRKFNSQDSLLRMPYNQELFDGILKDSTTLEDLTVIKKNLHKQASNYLGALQSQNLSSILSINNYHSGIAAAANYPTLTVPMGYKNSGEPMSLTFIGSPFSAPELLEVGAAFEQLTKVRKSPENYN